MKETALMKWGQALVLGVSVLCLLCTGAYGYEVTFVPRITVTEEYTDNVYLSAEDPQSAFVTTFTPGFTAQILTQNSGAELSYDPGYAFYSDDKRNNTWRDSLNLRAWSEFLEGSILEISDTYLRTEDPLAPEEIALVREEETTIGQAPTVRKGRQPYMP